MTYLTCYSMKFVLCVYTDIHYHEANWRRKGGEAQGIQWCTTLPSLAAVLPFMVLREDACMLKLKCFTDIKP